VEVLVALAVIALIAFVDAVRLELSLRR